jgi:hypothetical protein
VTYIDSEAQEAVQDCIDFFAETKDSGPRELLVLTMLRIAEATGDPKDALECAHKLLEGYVDVVDGDYGIPAPNTAMKLSGRVQEALDGLPK